MKGLRCLRDVGGDECESGKGLAVGDAGADAAPDGSGGPEEGCGEVRGNRLDQEAAAIGELDGEFKGHGAEGVVEGSQKSEVEVFRKGEDVGAVARLTFGRVGDALPRPVVGGGRFEAGGV